MIPLLLLVVIGLAAWFASMKSRIAELERDAERQRGASASATTEIARLSQRLSALETRAPGLEPARLAAPSPVAAVAPAAAAVVPPVRVAPLGPPTAAPHSTSGTSMAAEVGILPVPWAPKTQLPTDRPRRLPEPTARPIPPGVTVSDSATSKPDVTTAAGWEMTVGGNWLNKLGVLVFVIGLALLVGYSMTHVDPAGRVAIGFAVSLLLLGCGVTLERREPYRNYAYGLIAGGWAGTYFTTYAMHALDAARIIDSDAIGTGLLVLVAAAMIVHTLRYRSEVVTALGYIVGYATLMLSPLDTFSAVAAGLLAASSLVVAQRFGWRRITLLAAVATYGTFAWRREILGRPETALVTPFLSLGAYWVMFEVADVIGLRRQKTGTAAPAPLFMVNGAGLIGTALLEPALATPDRLSAFLACAAIAYLASAMIRARLLTGAAITTHDDAAAAAAFGTSQGATIAASALFAWAILTHFHGPRATLALLLEMELLLFSALAMRDRLLRTVALGGAGVVALSAFTLMNSSADTFVLGTRAWHAWVPVVSGVAGAWYVNAEWLRSRSMRPAERAYSYAASVLVAGVLGRELSLPFQGLGLLLFAAALLEAGLWRAREYRWQAYAAAGLGTLFIAAAFIADSVTPPTQAQATLVLSTSAALAFLTAVRAGWLLSDRLAVRERLGLAVGATAIGVLCVATLEWWIAPAALVALAWALTALALIAVARKLGARPIGWLADPLLFAAGARLLPGLMDRPFAGRIITADLGVIAVLYVASVLIPRSAPADPGHAESAGEIDDAVRVITSLAASALLMWLIVHDVRPSLVTLAWGLQGAGLLACGFPLRERVLRLSGLLLLFLCIIKLFASDLSQLEPLARIVSFVLLGVVLLLVSWIYTRFKEQIQRYL
jgi:uncharacterized membrane protein